MRIIVNGQQAFGQAVLEALLEKNEEVVAVYCGPDNESPRPDPIKTCALAHDLPVIQPSSFKAPEVAEEMRALKPDLCVMAYVTLFVPEEILNLPTHGSIQYHPSLLPRHRGGSSINWPIIWGEKQTGLSIFWPDAGLDEGPILLQKTVTIGDDDTLGSLYFNHLSPMGVKAMLEAVELVKAGNPPRMAQDHQLATYEGWCRDPLVQINWHMPTQTIWNLIRGANPQPGAWTRYRGEQLKIYDCEKILLPMSVQPGQVTAVDHSGVTVATADGQIKIKRLRPASGGKTEATTWAEAEGLQPGPGTRFG